MPNIDTPLKAPERKPIHPAAADAHADKIANPAPEPAEHATAPKRTRKPFGHIEQKLSYPKREGFVRRWFNDSPGRIIRAIEAGYAHVVDDRTGKNAELLGGKDERGHPVMMYLMEIPKDFYDEDFAAKQESLNEQDKAIYTGRHNQEAGDNRYIPRDLQVGQKQVRRA